MKERASRYWEEHGTLRGYEVPSIEAIQQQFLSEADAGISAAGGGGGEIPSFDSEAEAEASGYKGQATIGGRRAVIE